MTDAPIRTPLPARPRRSGSEKRQRSAPISVRVLDDERVVLRARAADAGLSLASYLRFAGLGAAGVRARRAPTVNATVLAQAIAALNKAGSNLNQIARALNASRAPGSADVLQTLYETRAAVLQIIALTGRRDGA